MRLRNGFRNDAVPEARTSNAEVIVGCNSGREDFGVGCSMLSVGRWCGRGGLAGLRAWNGRAWLRLACDTAAVRGRVSPRRLRAPNSAFCLLPSDFCLLTSFDRGFEAEAGIGVVTVGKVRIFAVLEVGRGWCESAADFDRESGGGLTLCRYSEYYLSSWR